MAINIFGQAVIQPIANTFAAAQEQTDIHFISAESGSYIYSGSDSALGVQQGHISFEDDGTLYSFVFSGSGFVAPVGLPGTVLSGSINGLSTSCSIAESFSSSIADGVTSGLLTVTASLYSCSIVTLSNNSFSSSIPTTSSFNSSILTLYPVQTGHAGGYIIGDDTTGSLIISGGFEVAGTDTFNIGTNKAAGTITSTFGGPTRIQNTLSISGSGYQLTMSSGSTNQPMGVATLVSGNVTVSRALSNNSFIYLQRISGSNTNAGELYITSQSTNTFSVSSSNAIDTGTFNYMLIGVTD